jgi:hypothetical protein
VNQGPKLLVEWSSPWQEFRSAIGPALARSPRRLAGEAHTGLFPYRGILLSWGLELALLTAVIVIPARLASMRPYEPPPPARYDIIYYSGDELPRTEDLGGAETGQSGRGGGQEAYHGTETIRVMRGNSLRQTVVDAPQLKLPVSNSAVANLLAYKPIPGPAPAEGMRALEPAPELSQPVVAPAPDVRSDNTRTVPSWNATIIAPTPDVERDKLQTAPAMMASIVPPSVTAPQRDMARLSVPGSQQVEVVAPPVSTPERATNLNPKLQLPAPTAVAPAPSVNREAARNGPGFGPGDLRQQIVPPSVQLAGGSGQRRAMEGLGTGDVVAPPVQLSAGSGQRQVGAGGLGGSLGGGTAIVPPPPMVGGGNSMTGQGRGNRGSGFGGALETGSVAAPATSGGSGNGAGVVVSSQPGSKVGVPGNSGSGTLAMSPSGGNRPGLGGNGGGSGIGRGDGPGSGFLGIGSGAGKDGKGRGSDPMARGGISPYPGPGGAGSGTNGTPAMAGVAVKGGSNNVVTLPSFNDLSPPAAPARSNPDNRKGPDITIVATSRSGGAFNFYGAQKGDRVYTIYIPTGLGTVVMQYDDPESALHPYAEDLVAPQVMRADLPAGLPKARLVIACVLDRSGLLRRPQVLEPGTAVMTSKVLAALSNWKFKPALRGNEPVEVNAILGFNIDTNDRF